MGPRWRLRKGHELQILAWDGQCLVHHLASNDTLRFQGWVGGVLQQLVAAPSGLQESALLAAATDLASEDLEQLRQELMRLEWLETSDD